MNPWVAAFIGLGIGLGMGREYPGERGSQRYARKGGFVLIPEADAQLLIEAAEAQAARRARRERRRGQP